MTYLHEEMKKIALNVVKASYPLIHLKRGENLAKTEFGFELFGLDFMLDSSYKLYLI